MELFLTIEAQNSTKIGIDKICWDIKKQLSFVTDKEAGLENVNNYGTEFRLISIIPTCVDNEFWDALGWKERKQVWYKKKEADIRLRMDYDRFIRETLENKRLMYVDIVVESIKVVQKKSKGDFRGNKLIEDILNTLNISFMQLNKLNKQ